MTGILIARVIEVDGARLLIWREKLESLGVLRRQAFGPMGTQELLAPFTILGMNSF